MTPISTNNKFSRSGFTLIEIIVGFAIIAMLFVVVILSLREYRDRQVLYGDTQAVLSLINEARTATLASKEQSVYGVHFESGRAVLFKGLTFTEPSVYNKEVIFNPAVVASTIVLNGGGSDMVFERLSGETLSYGTTTFSLTSNNGTTTIVVQPTGIAGEI